MEGLDGIVRLTIGGVAIWAGAAKLRSFRDSVSALQQYRLAPRALSGFVAAAVIAAELSIGIGSLPVVPPFIRQLAASGAVLLFAAFCSGIIVLMRRGTEAPCQCFGASDAEPVGGITLLRATALLALSLWAALRYPSALQVSTISLIVTVLTALGLIFILRALTVVPDVWRSLRAPMIRTPAPTRRVSFRYSPQDASLFESGTPIAKGSALTVAPD